MKIAGIHPFLKTITIFEKTNLEGNVQRDKQNYIKLESMGIKVIVVWGCEIKQMMKDESKLENLLNDILLE